MRKWICAVMALALIVVGFAASSPTNTASATTSWPIPVDNISADTVEVYSNGAIQLSACRPDLPNAIGSMYIDAEGVTRNSMQGPGSTNDKRCYGTGGAGLGYGAEDGTLYGMRMSTSDTSSELVAWKNDRELWKTVTTSPSNCMYSNGTSKAMWPTTISEGSDGNIYMILVGNILPLACNDRLLGVNPKTGVIVVDEPIGTALGNGQGLRHAKPTAWTFDDTIIVVDRRGFVREFSYAGVENTSVAEQLPASGGYVIDRLAVNNEGTVFAVAYSYEATSPTLLYHKRNGVSSAIPNSAGSTYPMFIEPTSDGNVIGVQYTGGTPRFDKFNLATNTVAVTNPSPLTPGYSSNTITAYSEDSEGNRLTMWSQSGADKKATSVDLYDSSTQTSSTVFLKEMKTADPTNYPNFQTMSDGSLRNAVGGGNLYISICEHSTSSCYGSSGAPDVSIYKVDVGDFATPLGKGFKRNSYENDKLEYVAMGDSFSSGEGNDPFLYGTDASGVNECHRSKDAYPELLEEDLSLNLNLTAFVACSGATTDTVKNGATDSGSWSEGSQLDALSGSTDLITISIGGNDVGFRPFMEACFEESDSCDTTSDAYSVTAGLIANSLTSKLIDLFEAIQINLGSESSAKILIIGYPEIISNSDLSAGSPWSCMARLTTGDLSALQSLAGDINSVVANSVLTLNDERFHFVNPMINNSSFSEHGMCSDDWYIYPYDFGRPYVFIAHPTKAGQETYAAVIKSYLASLD